MLPLRESQPDNGATGQAPLTSTKARLRNTCIVCASFHVVRVTSSLTHVASRSETTGMQVSQLVDGRHVHTAGLAPPGRPEMAGELHRWLGQLRQQVAAVLAAYVRDRCAEYVHDVPGAGFVTDLLTEFVAGGKYVRSTFTYLGWLSGAGRESDAALRAAASTELVHAFALLQDDVMDQSGAAPGPPRRTPAARRVAPRPGPGRPGRALRRIGRRSCSPTCAWYGRSSCCATAACPRRRWPGAGPATTRCAASWPSGSSPTC